MKDTLRYLSIVLSTISVISLLQHVGNVGVSSIFHDFISYYRYVAYEVFGLIGRLFSIDIPPTLMDVWTLSFIGAGAYVRTPNIEGSRLLRKYDTSKFPSYWKFIYFLLMGFTLVGLSIVFSALQPQIYVDDELGESYALSRRALKNVLVIVAGVVVFFVLNAYAPSA
ncbi:TPA: hypothetical protein GRI37_21195 [Vibrio parahaemolyticus]|uniref:Uncharacterized protein n=1 Tax=Vibrio parahaemolyticus TaxID=670 RepID=A0AA46L275_VIBPH|nr:MULTISPECIES: hypothetical protein [Gammaproteobacteria]EID4334180.1 hypothetical protein [Vibrio parahaemolyticus]TXN13621.1 hypothetical protein FVP01_23345 [Vibrio parahaemolyticus]HAS6741035.1 hypothetical protein [Vibrio parahaemolyticus]HAS6755781.1 hypothetical protein [Vibrio parahaemolyticus]HAS6775238.1 hypothetical protein [Vibrio parahaemolyticus]